MIHVKSIATRELAQIVAEDAVEILFSAGDPFAGQVGKDSLVREIRAAVLEKLVKHDTHDLTEEEFAACVQRAKGKGPAKPKPESIVQYY
jgi:hypothetical protein